MDGRVPTFLLNFPGISSAALSQALAERGFGVWSGENYYAPGLYERVAWGDALRMGLAHYNTLAEVDRFNQTLGDLVASRDSAADARHGRPARRRFMPETSASGALVTTVLDTRGVGGRLVRRLVSVPAGARYAGTRRARRRAVVRHRRRRRAGLRRGRRRSRPGRPGRAGRVPAGRDQRHLGARRRQLRAAGRRGPGPVRLDTVALPGGPAGGAAAPQVSELAACEAEWTGDRRFRVVFGPGRGCAAATQFVGEIPPGRAPEHSHTYDEVVLILAGTGIAHVDGAQHPVAAGTCVYLPPGQQHCLENTGRDTLLVLGVFQPGGSPAAKKVATGEAAP